ncbi:CD82 antigen-like [Mercenaria mercenaria]|uniref:CD82 antigen-like n=1 Tax=Mercenaria mercenaria TaxID=6596 RepID=UPI00234EBE73|nr:CD82 antigen-like [Mercenaria mercenaria]XP_045176813.2 CD82 antigen-like [Mercenaria mercenaria]XP_045176814.2 CD82 antigen-like [Mercenaria mercenaria]XP_053385001.1 CD82 antigen-like [Mercenaria mercenaria]
MGRCAEYLAKFGLIFFNIIFILSGIAVLGVGIWVVVDNNVVNMQNLVEFDSNDKSLFTAACILIGFGSFVLNVSVFGFLAACCASKSKFFIVGYLVFLVIIFIGEFAGGITAAVSKGKIGDNLQGVLSKSFEKYNPGNELLPKAWDYMQTWLQCCGSEGPKDYTNITFTPTTQYVPKTCCILSKKDPEHPKPVDGTACQEQALQIQMGNAPIGETFVQTQGCYNSLEDKIKSHFGVIIGVAVGIAIIQIFGIVLSICICRGRRTSGGNGVF